MLCLTREIIDMCLILKSFVLPHPPCFTLPGKLNQDVSHIIESTASRRELQSEKQSREDEEQRSEREVRCTL